METLGSIRGAQCRLQWQAQCVPWYPQLHQETCCIPLLFSLLSFNQIICKFKLVQLRYHQTGCHNTARKMKTEFRVSKNFDVQREREETSETSCSLCFALCCSGLSVTVYKPGLACEEVFIAGAGFNFKAALNQAAKSREILKV